MKKVFFFLALLSFLFASCSSNVPGEESIVPGDSSPSASISSSGGATPSSSSGAISSNSNNTTPSSSGGATPSSSGGTTPSSSGGATPSSSGGATPSSSGGAISSSSNSTTAGSSSSSKQNSSSSATAGNSSSSKQNNPPPSGGLTCADPVSTTATDYSDMKNWSVYTDADKLTKDVDIFLLYPTSIQSSAAEDCPYANINNSSMRNSVNQWYSGIKTVVTSNANVYLPYYRQANVFGSGCSGANMTGGAAMEDVIASFQYYLTHINKGQRPYMMLGFSQGSSPLWELAENRLEKICGTEFGAANRKNHIVTYATGIPGHGKIAANKPVKFSESYNDINVITAWNPYEEADTLCTSSQLGVHGTNGAPTTNPITWTIDENYHLMTENPKLNQNTLLGARVHNKLGILLVKKASNPATSCGSTGSMYMGMHGQDISLFSASIIQNMKDRIDAWKAKYR